MRAFKQEETEAPTEGLPGEHGRLDAVRSWLASGHHIFGVDPRRRRGHHGHARQLLADDRRARQTAVGDWQALASALDRHTVRGGMTELGVEERRVITLAYLEGRTNREIAAILGVSISTVRRRLVVGLKQLDAYISRSRTWLSAVLLLAAADMAARANKLGQTAHANWTQKVASAVAVGAVAAAAIGLAAVIPDTTKTPHSSTPGAPRLIAAAPRFALPALPSRLSNLAAPQKALAVTAHRLIPAGPAHNVTQLPAATEPPPATGSHHPNNGCDGNPTSAAPPVPVGRHVHGSPVTHPSAGGCRVLAASRR